MCVAKLPCDVLFVEFRFRFSCCDLATSFFSVCRWLCLFVNGQAVYVFFWIYVSVLLFVFQCLWVMFLVAMMLVNVCKWASLPFTLMYNNIHNYVYNGIWLYHFVYIILSKYRYKLNILLYDDIHYYACINIYSYMIVILCVCM